MAGSYFEMLTEQQGIPAKPFDPVEELKRLRRELALRTRISKLSTEKVVDPPQPFFHTEIVQVEIETDDVTAALPLHCEPLHCEPPCKVPCEPPPCETPSCEPSPCKTPPCETASLGTEPVTFETVTKKVDEMKKTLAIWQRSRLHTKSGRNKKPARSDIFRGKRQSWSKRAWNKRRRSSTVAHYLTTPHEGTLETANAGLMALGIVGVIFGVLSLFRGLETDLSVGSLVCATGAAIVLIGLSGRFLASRSHLAKDYTPKRLNP